MTLSFLCQGILALILALGGLSLSTLTWYSTTCFELWKKITAPLKARGRSLQNHNSVGVIAHVRGTISDTSSGRMCPLPRLRKDLVPALKENECAVVAQGGLA